MKATLWAWLGLLLLATGCATVPYPQGLTFEDPRLATQVPPETPIERGKPNRVLDASDWVWPGSWLGKLILWDRRVDNHKIGEETEALMQRYLDYNELAFVKVRLNQYAPRDEFRRLRHNKSMGAGWRYTIGVLGWLQYTLLPGRILGGDHYNPYSNTIHLFSDIPAIAVHEGGHAKDTANRKWKGFYSFIYILPFVNLYHEAVASNDALGYLIAHESTDLQDEGYRIMHPAYGTYIGGNAALIFPDQALPTYALAILGGHLSGREKIRDRRRSSRAEEKGVVARDGSEPPTRNGRAPKSLIMHPSVSTSRGLGWHLRQASQQRKYYGCSFTGPEVCCTEGNRTCASRIQR